jgi:hypothetical protein
MKRKPGMRTICNECDSVITSVNGVRLLNGNFDSTLPNKKMTKFTVYAHCDECYGVLKHAQV